MSKISKMQNHSQRQEVSVYQVEFNAIATGKIIAMSKRRIRWRYGFPNQEAINAGQSGTKCRGEEHDVTLIWSVTSGKRMIMSNGKQIYVGTNKTNVFEHRWMDLRGNEIRLLAHATSPMSAASNSRQYDLLVNGKSFFVLPKAYEIGLQGPSDSRIPGIISNSVQTGNSLRRSIATYSDSGRNIVHGPSESLDDLNSAIQASLQESREHLASKGRLTGETVSPVLTAVQSTPKQQKLAPSPPTVEEPLIDLLSDTAPMTQTTMTSFPNQNALVLSDAPTQQYQVDPFDLGSINSQQSPAVDEFAPKAPTYGDVSNQILLNYHSQPATNMHSQQSGVQNTSNPFDTTQNPFTVPTTPNNNNYQQSTYNDNTIPPQNFYQGQQQYGFR